MMEHLKFGDAILACYLAVRLADKLPGVVGLWALVTVMARAMEEAREKAGLTSYEGIDLRKVHVAVPRPPIVPSVAERAAGNCSGLPAIVKRPAVPHL